MNSRPSAHPVHPGGSLADAIRDRGTTPERLAAEAGLKLAHVRAVLAGRSGLSAADALRLGRYFGTSPDYWLNLQAAYELDLATRGIGPELDRIVPLPVVGPLDNGE